MMQRTICGIMAAGALAACSSTSDGAAPGSCADIAGNYRVTAARAAGTCDPKLDGDGNSTLAFSKAGDGRWNVLVPGVPGGCPGTLDEKTCKYIANCEAKGADGAVIATFSLDYTFVGTTYKGSSITGARPPAVPRACDVTYQEQGTRL